MLLPERFRDFHLRNSAICVFAEVYLFILFIFQNGNAAPGADCSCEHDG